MYVAYKDQVEFLIVYIREAHPEMLKEGHHTGIVGRPQDIDERVILATQCATEFKFTMPTVIDGMEGKVNADYKAAPVRVAITDLDGKIGLLRRARPPGLPPLGRGTPVLKRLVANKGYVPAPPEPQWGETVDGLRCEISFDPPNPRIGEEMVLRVQITNTAENSLGLILAPEQLGKDLILTADGERSLRLKPIGSETSQSKRSDDNKRRRQVHEIKPGDSVFCDIYGTLETASAASNPGLYHYQFGLAVNPDTAAKMEADKENGYAFPLLDRSGQFRGRPRRSGQAGTGTLRGLPRQAGLSPPQELRLC